MRESTVKRHLVVQAEIERHHRVLDLGCGTASLTLLIKKTHAEAEVVALDGDPKVLELLSRRLPRRGWTWLSI
jgi:ubiquinone/menaquinone biosynthesis C-methylase UbiE